MLSVRDLSVSVGGRRIIHGLSLEVRPGETVALFGPNGSGKTTLVKTLMGLSGYEVTAGRILFKERDITHLPAQDRARLGMGMLFQRPPSIKGVSLGDTVRHITALHGLEVDESRLQQEAQRLNLEGFLQRDLNAGFSGGELKRSELLQLCAQSPALLLFDEPDSGVDLVSIVHVGEAMNRLLIPRVEGGNGQRSGLIITHTGHILDYVRADRACVIMEGTIMCQGEPRGVLQDIRQHGYDGCAGCRS